jgi:hypothetical protein
VHRLRQDLERAGHEVWLDRDDIPGGAAWRRSIGEGIAGADVVLVVVTPASVASSNVERELTVADEQVKPLLPVLVEPTVIPPSLSFLLAGVQHVDLTTQRYPEAIAELHQALAAIAARRGPGADAAGGPDAAGSGGTVPAAHGGHGGSRGRNPFRERGPSRIQLAVALAVVVAVAAFLGGMVLANRNTDPLAIGSFLGGSGCDGVVLVTGVMPKGGPDKSGVKERMADTTAALSSAGVANVPVRYLDGDTSCFAAPGNWLVVAGPFAQANQAVAVCSAIRDEGEFGTDPQVPLSVRNVQASASCGG